MTADIRIAGFTKEQPLSRARRPAPGRKKLFFAKRQIHRTL